MFPAACAIDAVVVRAGVVVLVVMAFVDRATVVPAVDMRVVSALLTLLGAAADVDGGVVWAGTVPQGAEGHATHLDPSY